MLSLKEIRTFIKYVIKNKKFFKKAVKRSFLDEIASSENEELGDLLLSIQEEKDLTDEELVGFFMEKKLQYDAKNGIPAASIYIKAYRKLGGIRQFIEDGCLVMEDLENAVLDASV